MQSFSIRSIELLTGIKAHTLRVWEARYNFFKAPRKESQQRFYTNEDLQKLLCISFLYHNGWKVSKIARLTDEEIREEVERVVLHENNYPSSLQKLLQASVDFNEASFRTVLNELIDVIGFERTVSEICYPFLQKIGMLWDTNRVIPAQEHFSTYIIQNRIISETEKFSETQNGQPEIILFCPENEHHELPLLYLNYILRKNGWRVLYLGANVKTEDLQEAARLPGIRYLYLHLITNFTGFLVDDYFEVLHKLHPDKLIFASGKSVEQSQRSFVRIELLKRDEDIHRFARSKAQLLGST
jgi:DNA-binding transcriptional MerR regulator